MLYFHLREMHEPTVMSTKPHIQPTPTLSAESSRELVRSIRSVTLTTERRDALRGYANAALRAFAAPLPQGPVRKK